MNQTRRQKLNYFRRIVSCHSCHQCRNWIPEHNEGSLTFTNDNDIAEVFPTHFTNIMITGNSIRIKITWSSWSLSHITFPKCYVWLATQMSSHTNFSRSSRIHLKAICSLVLMIFNFARDYAFNPHPPIPTGFMKLWCFNKCIIGTLPLVNINSRCGLCGCFNARILQRFWFGKLEMIISFYKHLTGDE